MDASSPKERGAQLGFVQTMQGIGDVAGPLAGGLLIDAVSIQAPFFAGSIIYLLLLVFILKAIQIRN
jgi:MFS family permease